MSNQALGSSDNQNKQLVIWNPLQEVVIEPCRGINPFGNSDMLLEIIQSAELTTLADVKVLHFVSETQLPCHWEPKILAIVPNDGSSPKLQEIWKALRDPIRDEIGPVHSPQALQIFISENSARTIEQLYLDEQEGAVIFLHTCQLIAEASGGSSHFGPSNANITKSISSIESKVQRMQADVGCSTELAISQIDDGVRGTLSFKTPSQLKLGVETFMRLAEKNGWQIDCSNLWENEFDYGGYLDVDIRILIPLPGNRTVVAELQFHLKDFYDGTSVSPVSRAHKVYEEMRMIPVTGTSNVNLSYQELNETSRLYFTTALFHAKRSNSQ